MLPSPKPPIGATVVEHALDTVRCDVVFVPTHTGATARMLSRFKPAVWAVAASGDIAVRQGLAFSYGVWAAEVEAEPAAWWEFARDWMRAYDVAGGRAMLVAGPSRAHPDATHRIEFMHLNEQG
jgi:pyruvate kinase